MEEKSLLALLILLSVSSPLHPCFWWSLGDGRASNLRITMGDKICDDEKKFVTSRQTEVESALKKFLGLEASTEKKLPKIGLCMSGGGYRSMIASLGFTLGMQEIGLYSASSYAATLSGSFWLWANFLLRKKLQGINLKIFRTFLQRRVERSFFETNGDDRKRFLKKMLYLLVKRGKIEPVDLWGAIVAVNLLGDLPKTQKINFSTLRDLYKETTETFPYMLASAIFTDIFPYEWIEISPFVIGSDCIGGYIPTSHFDSSFLGGVCRKSFDERSVAWYLGLVGSAFNFSFGDALKFVCESFFEPWLDNAINKLIDKYDLHERRVLPSPVYNFGYRIGRLRISGIKETEISDAGMSFNIPFPLIRGKNRKVDIILVCDASSNASVKNYPEMHRAQAYMKRKGIPFPSLNNPKKISEHVVLFKDEANKEAPVILYFANPVNVSTMVFSYSKKKFDSLCDGMKRLVVENKDKIKETVLAFGDN